MKISALAIQKNTGIKIGEYEQSTTGPAVFRALQVQEMKCQNSSVMKNSLLIGGSSHFGKSGRDAERILPCFPRTSVPEKQGGKVRLRQATVCPL